MRHTNFRQTDEWLREKRKEEQKTRSNRQTGTNGRTDHRLTHKKERKGKQSVGQRLQGGLENQNV